jgi:hypothetical protein
VTKTTNRARIQTCSPSPRPFDLGMESMLSVSTPPADSVSPRRHHQDKAFGPVRALQLCLRFSLPVRFIGPVKVPSPAPVAAPVPAPGPPPPPYQLKFNGLNWAVSGGSPSQPREVLFGSQPAPALNSLILVNQTVTCTVVSNLLEMEHCESWIPPATSFGPPTTHPNRSSGGSSSGSGIFSSIGGAVNGIEAIGSGALKLSSSVLGIGGLLPGLGGPGPPPARDFSAAW